HRSRRIASTASGDRAAAHEYFVEAGHAACVVVTFVVNHSRPPAEYSAAYRLRTRATAGADRKISRSGSSSGNEFASRKIVVRLRSPCERAESRFPDSSSMLAAVACTCQAA